MPEQFFFKIQKFAFFEFPNHHRHSTALCSCRQPSAFQQNFCFIKFSIHPSCVGSLDGSISQAGLSHQNVAPTATFLRNTDGTIRHVANFNQFQGPQTVPLNSGFLRAFPNQHFAGQHLIQHAY